MTSTILDVFCSKPAGEKKTYDVHFIPPGDGPVLVTVNSASLKTMLGAVHAVVSEDLPRAYFLCKSEPHYQLTIHGSLEDGIQVTVTHCLTDTSHDVPLDDLLLAMLVAELPD